MRLVPTSEYDAVAKALYGDGFYPVHKAEKKDGLSRADKGLIASNVASAGIGIGTLNSLAKPARENFTGTSSTGRKGEAGGIFRSAARGAANSSAKAARKAPQGSKRRKILKPVVRGTRKTLHGMDRMGAAGGGTKGKVARGVIAGGLIGGAAFNTAADAASAYSISQKKNVKKNDDGVPKGISLKLKALDMGARKTAPKVKETAVRTKNAGAAATRAAAESWKAETTIAKAMEDKRQVYGWASITELNGEPVVDLQGDYVTIDEIEKAAHSYISKSRKGGDMHARDGEGPKHVADLIESVVITPEKKEALGLPEESPTGWWVGFQVHDDETWDLVKDGKRPMFSVHGSGRRQDAVI